MHEREHNADRARGPATSGSETMRALDTLVEQGKVRYLGFSDTPAWKVAQEQN